jgi:monoamine oxidase
LISKTKIVPRGLMQLIQPLPLRFLTFFIVWYSNRFGRKKAFFPQDIIIIGSGFAGLWSAKLKNPSFKITILEREA